MMQKCQTCGRAGDDVVTCGSFVTCPKATVPVEPTDVILQCDHCEITRAVSAPRIIHGKPLPAAHVCPLGEDTCECRPVVVSAKPDAKVPARGKKQEG